MPDFTTHVLFGELLLSRMPQEMREEALAAGAAYFWGAQGPDPLFYAGGLKGDNALRKLGGQMHRRHPQQLLEELVRSARDASPEEKPLLKAYALGFLAHYCLDRQVHPYVYFLVERRKRALPEDCWPSIHGRVECHIDDLLYPRMKEGRPVQSFRPKDYCPLDEALAASLARLYRRLAGTLYGQAPSSEELAQAFRACLRYTCLFYGPFRGITAWLARFADRRARCPGLYSSHVKGLLAGDDNDVLNLHQRPWQNLCRPEEGPSVLSVPQLLEEAAQAWLELALPLWEGMEGRGEELPPVEGTFDEGNPRPPREDDPQEDAADQPEETGGKLPASSLSQE